MRIAIDDSAAFNQGAGIGRYARNLVPAMLRELPDAKTTILYAPEPSIGSRFAQETAAMFSPYQKIRIRRLPLDRRRMDQLWFRARLPIPIEVWTGIRDLIYSPDFTAPPSLRAPTIVTVHDLAFEIVPERAPESLRRFLSAVVPRQINRAAAIVAVSKTTKNDLESRYGIQQGRVVVIPNAADERFFSAPPLSAEARRRLALPDQFLLVVGTIEPRKNHLNLFAAIERLPQHACQPLVVAGRIGWDAHEIIAKAEALQRAGRVILLDHVDDNVLPSLYASASAVVYPSWYEGFGLPVLEALASGTPVIASDIPAHREVAHNLATFVDPGDVDDLADVIRNALESRDEQPGLSEQRRARARSYSWERSGQMLANLFREVAAT